MRKWLIEARKAKRLTQAEVGKLVHMPQSNISYIEHGLGIRPSTAKKIAAVLGVDWTRFYDDEEVK